MSSLKDKIPSNDTTNPSLGTSFVLRLNATNSSGFFEVTPITNPVAVISTSQRHQNTNRPHPRRQRSKHHTDRYRRHPLIYSVRVKGNRPPRPSTVLRPRETIRPKHATLQHTHSRVGPRTTTPISLRVQASIGRRGANSEKSTDPPRADCLRP